MAHLKSIQKENDLVKMQQQEKLEKKKILNELNSDGDDEEFYTPENKISGLEKEISVGSSTSISKKSNRLAKKRENKKN